MTTNDYQIWITYNAEKQKLHIPVNPETINIDSGSSNKSVMVAELGEITIMQSRAAVQFSFSSFFPAHSFPGVKAADITDPLELVEKISEWKNSKNPVHLIITSSKINCYCTIEKFTYWENGGDVGTIHYDITLKEYREITTRQVKVDTKTQKATVDNTQTRVDNSVQPKTYTVVAGDCLWSIAQKMMGNGARYKELYNANKSVIDPRNQKYGMPTYTIYAGQVFTIPA